ncbi:GIY-YIG nuclease family protein [Christiangramia echinicola]|uniref:GIY-YIG nuclease family protein n=1 Tax=Christiangramia echinicola TaxID=279359 RepID=UPI00047EC80B|nr:GIY-YIG nuclease family protein [Christiangramia echinicola]
MQDYFVYIVTNEKRSVLYIGITNNLNIRLDQHYRDSVHSKLSFAGKYNCYHLIYFEKFNNASEAIIREKTIKKWRREKKLNLIGDFNPEWQFLERDIL